MIAEKRRARFAKRRNNEPIGLDDYVLTQPPVYTGPPRPPGTAAAAAIQPPRAPIPVVADFLKAAAEQYRFVPQRPNSDIEFKRAYAKAAAAAGLTRDQTVRIYAFETGGNGTYDVQAGLDASAAERARDLAGGRLQPASQHQQRRACSPSTATTSSRRCGSRATLASRGRDGRKVEALRRMIAFSRTVPNAWSEHDKLAKTTQGGIGIHAAVLDLDVGPLLQVQKLLNSVHVRADQGPHGAADGGRARDDELHRRRQRHRSGDDAAGLARARADLELLPARRL